MVLDTTKGFLLCEEDACLGQRCCAEPALGSGSGAGPAARGRCRPGHASAGPSAHSRQPEKVLKPINASPVSYFAILQGKLSTLCLRKAVYALTILHLLTS